jgi:hypothetical protein
VWPSRCHRLPPEATSGARGPRCYSYGALRIPRVLPLLAALAAASACATGVNDDDSEDSGGPYPAADASTDHATATDASPTYDVAQPTDTGAGDVSIAADSGTGKDGEAGSITPSDTGAPDTAAPETGSSTCVGHGFAGALVTFDLSSQTGSETSAAATSSATGVTGGALSRAAALTAESGSGSINSSGWGTTTSADATKYYTFTVTPASGCTVALTTLALDVKASSTGPASGNVATSADSFGVHSTTFAGTATPSVSLGVSSTSAIEIRVYGFGASSSSGTFRVENTLTLSGSIQ